MSAGKDLEKKQEDGLALSSRFLDDAGDGMGNADVDAFARPQLTVLQKMSPQVDEGAAGHIEGARAGMILKSDTGELFDGKRGVLFIPAHYSRTFVEWGPERSGFVAEHNPYDDVVKQISWSSDNKPLLPNGNLLVDTRNHYGVIIDDDGVPAPVVISMSSTMTRASKYLMSQLRAVKKMGPAGLFTPPTYASVFRLTTVTASNDKGTWYTWSTKRMGDVEDMGVYAIAREFAAQAKAGTVQISRVETDGETLADDAPF